MFSLYTETLYTRFALDCRYIASCRMGTTSKNALRKNQSKDQKSNFGLNKQERRTLRKRLLEEQKETGKMHIFKNLYPWQNKWKLASHLKGSEVYNDGGLIALCKPYGIPQSKQYLKTKKDNQTVVQTLTSGGMPEHVPSIEDTIPVLKDLYNVDHLEVIKSAERWSSGIILLSTNSKLTETVKKSFRTSQALQQPHMTYWAVTCGMPNPVAVAAKVPLGLEYAPNTGKVPVIKKNYTQNEIKRGDVKMAVVEHLTKVYNNETDMSLVEVNVLLTKMHFLRVWLAYSYSPILGDHLFGGRVKSVAGKKVLVSPQNLTSYVPQSLPDDTFSKLNLADKAVEMIPCHLHLAKLRLSSFLKSNSDLIITAPPPDHFMWTCRQLGLMSMEDMEESEDCSEKSL